MRLACRIVIASKKKFCKSWENTHPSTINDVCPQSINDVCPQSIFVNGHSWHSYLMLDVEA